MGADERIFKNLEITDYQLQPVPWLPFETDDTIPSYAKKMSAQIPGENPILIGLSLGGMICTEIGKLRSTKKIFLVSSAKTSAELPAIARMPMVDKLIDQLPEVFFTRQFYFFTSIVGAKNAAERKLLAAMMQASAQGFIRWSLKAVVAWNSKIYPANVIHIHGNKDMVIPSSNLKPDYMVKDGTHLMIYNRAAEVSKIISDCLSA